MTRVKFDINIDKFEKKAKLHLMRNMKRVMIFMVNYVKTNFGPSNQRGLSPSGPGQPPNIGSGTLRNAITFTVKREGRDVVGIFGVMKGPASSYAAALEHGFVGTDSAGRNRNLAPRPFLTPAYRKNKARIVRILSGK